MCQRSSSPADEFRESGFTLFEFLAAVTVLSLGVVPVVGLLISLNHQREAAAVRYRVLGETQTLLERVLSADPAGIAATFDATVYPVDGVQSVDESGNIVSVFVDDSDPELLQVSAEAEWLVNSQVHSLTLETQVFDESW